MSTTPLTPAIIAVRSEYSAAASATTSRQSLPQSTQPNFGDATPAHQPFDLDFEEEEDAILSHRLPPVDGGWKAWKFLAAVFMIEGLCWGFPQSYGVFQEYYVEHAGFTGSGVSLVGTLSSGLMYMSGVVSFPIANKYPRQRQLMQWGGLLVFCTGCALASFATNIWHLILTQGLLCGLGSAVLYAPGVVLMNEWWVEKRGTAMGIMYCGTGVAGVIVPLLFGSLLNSHGFRSSLRIWAVIMFIMTAVCIPFIHGRAPVPARNPPRARGSRVSLQLRMLKSPMFLLLALANVLQALGHFIPPLYLPSFAHDLSLSSVRSTSLVSVLNGSTVFGRLLSGYMSDKIDLSIPMFLSSAVSGISALAIWGVSDGYAALLAFAVVFGCWSGGWSVLWSRFCTAVVRDERERYIDDTLNNAGNNTNQRRHGWSRGEEADAIAGMYGALSLGRGLGNIFTGPISSKLLATDASAGLRKGEFGLKRYEALVVMTGAIMIGSACVAIGGRFWRKFESVGRVVKRAAA